MTRPIAGTLDAAGLARLAGHVDDAEYRRRAELNRPDPDGLRLEALRLHATGLRAADISTALKVPLDIIETWLARGAESAERTT
ncbi:MAG: hypothetical protein DYH20_04285 [Gammaproteobacteria bacterium PRO9]|nr:hypothetical protein [Gammaproteobacteria bacterium PRO9]